MDGTLSIKFCCFELLSGNLLHTHIEGFPTKTRCSVVGRGAPVGDIVIVGLRVDGPLWTVGVGVVGLVDGETVATAKL